MRAPRPLTKEMRARFWKGQRPYVRDLAREYGVSKSAIGYVVSGGTWR